MGKAINQAKQQQREIGAAILRDENAVIDSWRGAHGQATQLYHTAEGQAKDNEGKRGKLEGEVTSLKPEVEWLRGLLQK